MIPKRRVILEANQSAGALLRQLADRLKLDLRIDVDGLRRAGISLDQRILLRVENATIDVLLLEVVGPLRLDVRRDGNVVEIGPAD